MNNIRLTGTHSPAQPGQRAVHSCAKLHKKAETVYAAGNRGALHSHSTQVTASCPGQVLQRISATGVKSWDVLLSFMQVWGLQ